MLDVITLKLTSGKSQCPSICDSDFDCRWGQVCEYGICSNNEEIHWKCNGVFNDPHESCNRYTETQGINMTEKLSI